MAESPEAKYVRLQAEIQQAILNNFANPGRRGCAAEAAVRAIATKPDHLTADDDNDDGGVWSHVTHCTPCYASFFEHRRRRSSLFRRLAFAAALATVGGLGCVLWITLISHK